MTAAALTRIVWFQRFLIVGFVLCLLVWFLGPLVAEDWYHVLLWKVQISIAIPAWLLLGHLRASFFDRLLAAALCLWPGIGLIFAMIINHQTTKALTFNGYQVGLWGARGGAPFIPQE
ncbi:MAG: hypothetical protein EA401_00975 [Planctomycetota bacterium]|nr:MAG: hypothetical protein EA401_00975 [Planctomycetota bacterium]